MPLAPDIVQRVRTEAGADADTMLALLSALASEVPEVGDRVLRCLVYLSRGSLASLSVAAETARQDWRDTIVAAEYEPRPGTKRFQSDYIQVRDFNQPFT
jgi:hypothetical protein